MKKSLLASFLSLLFLTVIVVSTIPIQTQAQDGSTSNPPTGSQSNSPTGSQSNPKVNTIGIEIKNPFSVGDNLYDLIKAIVDNIILPIGGVLCVLSFIYAGFKYVISQGSPKGIEEANRALLYSAVGTAVLLGAWVIAGLIQGTVNQFR